MQPHMPVEAAWLGWGHERPCKTWKKTTIKWKPVITSIWSSSYWQNCPLGPPSRVQALAENRERGSCRKIKFMWVHFMQQESQEFASFSQSNPVFLHLFAHSSIHPLFFNVRNQNIFQVCSSGHITQIFKSFPVWGLAGLHNYNQASLPISGDMHHLFLLALIYLLHFCHKSFLQDFKRIMIYILFASMTLSKWKFS